MVATCYQKYRDGKKSLLSPFFFVPSMVVAWLVGEVGAILGGWTWLEAKSEAISGHFHHVLP